MSSTWAALQWALLSSCTSQGQFSVASLGINVDLKFLTMLRYMEGKFDALAIIFDLLNFLLIITKYPMFDEENKYIG